MGRELQKRKARSSRSKVKMPNRRKKALNPLGSSIIAKNWFSLLPFLIKRLSVLVTLSNRLRLLQEQEGNPLAELHPLRHRRKTRKDYGRRCPIQQG